MDLELKEEDLLGHYILNGLSENHKMDMFGTSLPLLNYKQWYIHILPNQVPILYSKVFNPKIHKTKKPEIALMT